MKLLFIGFPESIHAARWLSLVADQGWEIHFLPATDISYIHPNFRNVNFWVNTTQDLTADPSVNLIGWPFRAGTKIVQRTLTSQKIEWISYIIGLIKPNLIHSMEFQHAGYLMAEVKKFMGDSLPPWLATNWGCDIYLYGRLAEHQEKIKSVLKNCNYYSCECERDIKLAQDLGLAGQPLPVVPNSGGFELEQIHEFRAQGKISDRRVIAVKGYHLHMHRAQVALRALEMCADQLHGYKIKIYTPAPRNLLEIPTEVFQQNTGVEVELLPYLPHDKMLQLHGSSRISISLSIADGICTSFLEAMAMGSFPIQSWTSCADEWVEDGVTAALVPPEDPHIIAKRIREALTDDHLVNNAAELNLQTTKARADKNEIQKIVLKSYYQKIFNDIKTQQVPNRG